MTAAAPDGPLGAGPDDDRVARSFAEFVARLQRGEPIDVDPADEPDPERRTLLREALHLARDIANPLAHRVPEIPGFRLLHPLGHGSSATVWLAEQKSLGRQVALKVVLQDSLPNAAARERCLREARTLARIHDPRVVAVHDVIEHDGFIAIAMDHVPGPNLRTLLRAQRAAPDRPPAAVAAELLGVDRRVFGPSWTHWVVRQGARLCRALAGLHAHDLVHRDVKPENVLVQPDGETILADLGLARGSGESPAADFAGTRAYAAPEQLRGGTRLDGRADVFALGVTLYELLAQSLPIADPATPGSRPLQLPPLRRCARHISRDLAIVVHHALEVDPDRRYADANAFADDLERVLHLQPIHAAPPSLLGRALRLVHRQRRAALGVAVGVVVTGAAFVPLVRALRARMEAPRLAAELTLSARTRLIGVMDLATDAGEDRRLGDAAPRDQAGLLRLAIEDFDEALRHRADPAVSQEREVAALAAALLDARQGEFPHLLIGSLDQSRAGGANGLGAAVNAAGMRWLRSRVVVSTSVPVGLDAAGLRALGLLASLLGDLRSCEDCWSRLEPTAPDSPLIDAGLGMLFHADGRPERALPCLLRSASAFPAADRLALRLADTAVQLGDAGLARRALAPQVVASSLTRTERRRIEADVLFLAGDLAGAQRAYEDLLAADAGAILPQARLAALQLRGGQETAAVRTLQHLVEQHPDLAWLRLELARAALAVGDLGLYLQQARSAARRLADRSRPSRGSVQALAEILRLGDFAHLLTQSDQGFRTRTALGMPEPTVAAVLAARTDHHRLERLLERLVEFDRSEWPIPRSAERHLVAPVAILARTTLALREAIVQAASVRGLITLAAASWLQRQRGPLAQLHLPRVWLQLSPRLVDEGPPLRRVGSVNSMGDSGDSLASVCSGGAMRIAVFVRAPTELAGRSKRLVSPLGSGATSLLRLVQFGEEPEPVLDLTLGGQEPNIGVGSTAVPDGDGDGWSDLAVVWANLLDRGLVQYVSGRTGAVQWTLRDFGAPSIVPWSIAGIDDVDGDGVGDLALGMPSIVHPLQPTATTRLLSGRDGRTLAECSGPANRTCGLAVATLGDLDGDRLRDVAVGCPHRQTGPGLVVAISGRDAQSLREFRAPDQAPGFGRVIRTVADVDGDGQPELAVSDAAARGQADELTTVWLLSPASRRIVWAMRARQPGDGFGTALASIADVNGDGIADVLVGAPRGGVGQRGEVSVHSGADGAVLRVFGGPAPQANLGSCLLGTEDEGHPAHALSQDRRGQTHLYALPAGSAAPVTPPVRDRTK